jgi:hypothetical protein
MPAAGAAALYQVLRRFDTAVQEAGNLDVAQAFEVKFIERASDRAR